MCRKCGLLLWLVKIIWLLENVDAHILGIGDHLEGMLGPTGCPCSDKVPAWEEIEFSDHVMDETVGFANQFQ
jgi:hypothetical protein